MQQLMAKPRKSGTSPQREIREIREKLRPIMAKYEYVIQPMSCYRSVIWPYECATKSVPGTPEIQSLGRQ
ncbi:hypothetical protein GCM10022414_29210 [Zhongshania borealis]|uniref:Uncharacterized protein n=1 Tax=Zhongshania borealis TaxID=889488 RepID=A0ABP7X1S7_9GAMM